MDRQKDGWTDPILEDLSGRGWESNNLSSASDWWEYTKSCFIENAKIFSKNSTTQENITILRLKLKLQNLYKKEKFKPEIKPMTENLQVELYHLENKQAKGGKLCANIRNWSEKMPQNFLLT